MQITVVDYDSKWETMYLKEELALKEMLQEDLISSFHIGSTSVSGLKAKPIIDILLVVNDIAGVDTLSSSFEKLGYEVMGEFGIKGRRYFRKGGDNRTHQIHAFQFDQVQDIERHLSFRDYLRQNPQVCVAYGDLKRELAAKYPNDIEGYGDGKDDFVKKVEQEALKWHWKTR
ncbi:GrpB family protein [Listeria kieliensis]|uniref:Glutamate-rich protein GrpB n=1 Tax=Listeria kieliensis TaxID=1621700 RepID=A0A3D8TV53_9LIST|nr:GrpB family protein [Listeria kieliensis]RDX02537.1 hypothetical protein UR08_03210 [Listeria kieliensis]